jgi:hypothetical protein
MRISARQVHETYFDFPLCTIYDNNWKITISKRAHLPTHISTSRTALSKEAEYLVPARVLRGRIRRELLNNRFAQKTSLATKAAAKFQDDVGSIMWLLVRHSGGVPPNYQSHNCHTFTWILANSSQSCSILSITTKRTAFVLAS